MYDILIVFGPPHVTLKCSADFVTLNKSIEVSWIPTLLKNETFLSPKEVDERIQNCEAHINCSSGYTRRVSNHKFFYAITPTIIVPHFIIASWMS